MARIRTIKPSFWPDELVGAMPAATRLTFIGMFSLADDEGRIQGSAAYIKSQVFTYDESTSTADVERALMQLHNERRIRLYGNGRQRFAEVVNFRAHQRIDRPQPSQLPAPGRSYPTLPYEGGNEQDFRDTLDVGSTSVRARNGMEEEEDKEETPSSAASTDPAEPTVARQLFDWYCQLWGKTGQFAIDFTRKRELAIEKALKLHDARVLAQSIQGHHDNPWRHEGLSRNDIAVLMRPENIDVGREWYAKRQGAAPTTTAAAPKQDAVAEMGYEL